MCSLSSQISVEKVMVNKHAPAKIKSEITVNCLYFEFSVVMVVNPNAIPKSMDKRMVKKYVIWKAPQRYLEFLPQVYLGLREMSN